MRTPSEIDVLRIEIVPRVRIFGFGIGVLLVVVSSRHHGRRHSRHSWQAAHPIAGRVNAALCAPRSGRRALTRPAAGARVFSRGNGAAVGQSLDAVPLCDRGCLLSRESQCLNHLSARACSYLRLPPASVVCSPLRVHDVGCPKVRRVGSA